MSLAVAGTLGLMAVPASAQQTDRPARAYAVVLASSLNVREAPRLDAAVLGAVARGDTLCVLDVRDDWMRVRMRARGAAEPLVGFAARGFLAERRVAHEALRAVGCG